MNDPGHRCRQVTYLAIPCPGESKQGPSGQPPGERVLGFSIFVLEFQGSDFGSSGLWD